MLRSTLCAAFLLVLAGTARADLPYWMQPAAPGNGPSGLGRTLEWLNPFAIPERLAEARARAQAANNLRQIGIAVQRYEDAVRYPATKPYITPTDPAFKAILPYIEQDYIYKDYFVPPAGSLRLGANVGPLPEALVEQMDLPKGQGLLVTDVTAESPAAKAGLKKHDILLEWDGKPVASADEFFKAVEAAPSKKGIAASVLRKGKETAVKDVTLGDFSPFFAPYKFNGITDGTSNTIIIGETQKQPKK